jgi:hypothetical protein
MRELSQFDDVEKKPENKMNEEAFECIKQFFLSRLSNSRTSSESFSVSAFFSVSGFPQN